MKQRTYSAIKPEKKFNIENIENGKCTVLFFDNIVEENTEIENKENTIKYVYDMYKVAAQYRENLAEEIENNYEKWLEFAKKEDYENLAAEVRAKRNELLKDTDKEMCIDRLNLNFPDNLSMTNIISSLKEFFDGFASISKSNIAKYRQELRDITKQEGFPYKVVWPTKDKED